MVYSRLLVGCCLAPGECVAISTFCPPPWDPSNIWWTAQIMKRIYPSSYCDLPVTFKCETLEFFSAQHSPAASDCDKFKSNKIYVVILSCYIAFYYKRSCLFVRAINVQRWRDVIVSLAWRLSCKITRARWGRAERSAGRWTHTNVIWKETSDGEIRNLGGAGLGPSKKKERIRRTLNYFSWAEAHIYLLPDLNPC